MNKWYGKVGFATQKETAPDVYKDVIEDRHYYGDILKISRRYNSQEKINPDVITTDQISIIADAFATEHFYNIRYVEYMGVLWTPTSIDVQYPRLIITLGGLYNASKSN